jgi:Domain of unknown function (DUF4168)
MSRNLLVTKGFKQPVTQISISSLGFTPPHMATLHISTNFSKLSRPLLLSALVSFLSIGVGLVPDFTAQQSSQIFSSTAQAQEFSDSDLRNYAAALMQIEPIRQSALTKVSQANGGGKLPNLVCSQPDTMAGLNSEAKSLFINYCNQCESIATSRGLSIEKFNQITQSLRSNSQLKEKVRSFMN